MTRLEWFETNKVLTGFKLGIISVSNLTKYDIYKTFLEFKSQGMDKTEAIKCTVDDKYTKYTTVWRAIEWFEGRDSN